MKIYYVSIILLTILVRIYAMGGEFSEGPGSLQESFMDRYFSGKSGGRSEAADSKSNSYDNVGCYREVLSHLSFERKEESKPMAIKPSTAPIPRRGMQTLSAFIQDKVQSRKIVMPPGMLAEQLVDLLRDHYKQSMGMDYGEFWVASSELGNGSKALSAVAVLVKANEFIEGKKPGHCRQAVSGPEEIKCDRGSTGRLAQALAGHSASNSAVSSAEKARLKSILEENTGGALVQDRGLFYTGTGDNG